MIWIAFGVSSSRHTCFHPRVFSSLKSQIQCLLIGDISCTGWIPLYLINCQLHPIWPLVNQKNSTFKPAEILEHDTD
jgi:hypothetical protein